MAKWQQNRFTNVGEKFQSLELYPPDAYRPIIQDPETRAMRPANSVRYEAHMGAVGAVQLFNDGVGWYDRLVKDQARSQPADAGRASLPAGEDYVLYVLNPGEDDEQATFYADTPPRFFTSPKDMPVLTPVRGVNFSRTDKPNEVYYIDSKGKVRKAPVVYDPKPIPAASPGVRYTNNASVIDREPNVVRHGDSREMPADARFDEHYPGGPRVVA
jgi:hypothetical protein